MRTSKSRIPGAQKGQSMLRRYRYRAYPTQDQQRALTQTFGCARVVYNDALAARYTARRAGRRYPTATELSRQCITEAKRSPQRAWLGNVSSVALQQALADSDRAWRNFFHARRKCRMRNGPPRFKTRRAHRQAVRFTRNAFQVQVIRRGRALLRLPKIGEVRLAWSRDLPSVASSVTVIRESDGRFYVSFVADTPKAPLPEVDTVAGVDLGLIDLAAITHSNGTRDKVANPRVLRSRTRALARAQKSLSRKQKGSKNREKARCRVAALHRKVRATRLDTSHKLALRLVRENQTVAVEGLCVTGLARTRLAKAVLDAGWGQLIRLLHEKAEQHGREVITVSRWEPTSRVCSVCRASGGKKPLSVREWRCTSCGAWLDRDFNAAVNVMVAAGLAETLNVCGSDTRLRLAGAVRDEAGTRRTEVATRDHTA